MKRCSFTCLLRRCRNALAGSPYGESRCASAKRSPRIKRTLHVPLLTVKNVTDELFQTFFRRANRLLTMADSLEGGNRAERGAQARLGNGCARTMGALINRCGRARATALRANGRSATARAGGPAPFVLQCRMPPPSHAKQPSRTLNAEKAEAFPPFAAAARSFTA
jgi:hypothetical protein